MTQQRWTKAEIVRLREIWTSDMTVGAIAEDLGRTRHSVHQKAQRLKLPAKTDYLSDADKARFRRMWGEGRSIRSLMAEMGRSRNHIVELRRKLGLRSRRHAGKRSDRIVLMIDTEMKQAIGSRIFDRYTNAAEYVRVLIRRDLGMSS